MNKSIEIATATLLALTLGTAFANSPSMSASTRGVLVAHGAGRGLCEVIDRMALK